MTVLVAGIISGGEPKVCEEDLGPVLVTQDVKGFQIPMVDKVRMTVIYSIDDLEEGGLDASRIASVRSVIVDHVVEAPSGAIIEDGGGVVAEFDVLVQGDDVGVFGEEVVERALLFPLRRLVHDLQHQLTCVDDISGAEDGAVATVSEVLLDVEFIANLSPQQLRFELIDVRVDEHRF